MLNQKFTNEELFGMIQSQGAEMRDLKAALSYALDSDDIDEIKKRAKWALMPYWMPDTWKNTVTKYAKGEYHKGLGLRPANL